MASDGAEAVRRFRDERFDLVLMDVQMPTMDGLAATRAMRTIEREREGPSTPIAMITANVSAEHQLAAIAAGADAHLGKPIDQDLLWELVNTVASGAFPGRAAPARAE
jgi:CheY-like chemotaxis protein